tara:strand:- start:25806 stop:26402 length:597 start_codon:yes stop_codon:yes gene_type:complete
MVSEDQNPTEMANFGGFSPPPVVDYDESLILTQTIDPNGSSGFRLYQLEKSTFAFTTFTRDAHSGTGWSEFLIAEGKLTIHPPSFDMDSLFTSLNDISVNLSKNQIEGALEIYKTQCIDTVESALFISDSVHEIVFRGPFAYVEDFSWPAPLSDELQSLLEPDQIELIIPLILSHREGLDDDSWVQLRGHYMALIEIA